ncbi:MAG TPA: hypothetical protein VKV28_17095 [Candidatus Binataceae bacterium]|nr:hypothetical protein [Candidatus Binataceae bacterium]
MEYAKTAFSAIQLQGKATEDSARCAVAAQTFIATLFLRAGGEATRSRASATASLNSPWP